MTDRKVAVIGLGTIGLGWAVCFAVKGLTVSLFDQQEEARGGALTKIKAILQSLEEIKQISAEEKKAALRNLFFRKSVEEALEGADFVQESIYENYGAKKELYRAMDRLASRQVILASSSSGLLMTEIQTAVENFPERCLIGHPINPVYLIPLVEIVPGRQTGPDFLREARGFYESIGKLPVTLKKEVPGYLENRLTAALWREAIDLVMKDVATVEDVDKTIYAGPGLRYALMGPHMIYHLGGGEGGVEYFMHHLGDAFTQWWEDMDCWTTFPPGTAQKLSQGIRESLQGKTVAEMSAWRDRKLVELLKVVNEK